jgi:hypothetical protein
VLVVPTARMAVPSSSRNDGPAMAQTGESSRGAAAAKRVRAKRADDGADRCDARAYREAWTLKKGLSRKIGADRVRREVAFGEA